MSSGKTHKDVFTHDGYVSRINGNSMIVALEPNLECEACHARGACGVKGSSSKEIEVNRTDNSLVINDPVKVYLKKTTGMKAVFWAYMFPFILMFFTLILASSFFKEWIAGLLSLFILLPYYFTLYVLKDKLKSSFSISVLKT